MKDIPDRDATTPGDFERRLKGYPYDRRSRRLEREKENEAERKGDCERDEKKGD